MGTLKRSSHYNIFPFSWAKGGPPSRYETTTKECFWSLTERVGGGGMYLLKPCER